MLVELTNEEQTLLTIRDEIYKGSWNKLIKDLRDRLRKRPYLYKLANRIKADIERAEKMKNRRL